MYTLASFHPKMFYITKKGAMIYTQLQVYSGLGFLCLSLLFSYRKTSHLDLKSNTELMYKNKIQLRKANISFKQN